MTILFKSDERGWFSSQTLWEHLLRGAVASALLLWAVRHQSQSTLSILAAIGALIAFRGCPVCWFIGLLETLRQKVKSPEGKI